MLLLRGEAPFAQRGWKDSLNVSLQEASALKRRFIFFPHMPTYPVAACCLIYARLFRSDPDPVQCFKGGRGPSAKMKPSVPVASVSGRMTKARSAATKSCRLPRSSSQPADRNGGGRPHCLAAHANGFLSPPETGCLCQPWRSCQSDRATRL